jgi:hypothetical protein
MCVVPEYVCYALAILADECSTRPEDFTDLSLDFPPKPEGGAGRARSLLECLAHFTHAEEIEMRCEKCGKIGAESWLYTQFPTLLCLHRVAASTD